MIHTRPSETLPMTRLDFYKDHELLYSPANYEATLLCDMLGLSNVNLMQIKMFGKLGFFVKIDGELFKWWEK